MAIKKGFELLKDNKMILIHFYMSFLKILKKTKITLKIFKFNQEVTENYWEYDTFVVCPRRLERDGASEHTGGDTLSLTVCM